MADMLASQREATRLLDRLRKTGADQVETDILQPAETLLDLYGEDIRARAYVTHDPLRGETMLRPDFTVPVVQMHMSSAAAQAQYIYAGKVFRIQEDRMDRPREYLQVGYEDFGDEDRAVADARVFGLFADILSETGARPATGDIGLLIAAVSGLRTTDRRKSALLRHIWRPRRFRALLDRFSEGRAVREISSGVPRDAQIIGKRTVADVEGRLAALRAEAATDPIGAGEVELLSMIFGLRETMPNVVSNLADISIDMPGLQGAVDRLRARADALAAGGIDIAALEFEASYGRTSMEYYDGFVFGFSAPDRPDLPPVAQGGRYDALTRVLGQGRGVAAVGGIFRPAAMLEIV